MSNISSELRIAASQQAFVNLKAWESALSLRISLQKILETGNKLPILLADENHNNEVIESNKVLIKSTIGDLYEMLQSSSSSSSNENKKKTKKRKHDSIEWEDISNQYDSLVPRWKDVLNKWNSRLQFGSKDSLSKMKTFKQTYWEQIDVLMVDEKRNIEKSRIPWTESTRMNKNSLINNDNDLNRSITTSLQQQQQQPKFDEEVYDDRQFYSLLLKTFISQQQSSTLLSANKDDLEALKKYRKAKNNVERKASKGRKIRYTTHTKLQNFMFPITSVTPDMDATKLFQSLFQT